MIKKSIMALVVTLVCASTSLLAAVPPMREPERQSQAEYIFEGTVVYLEEDPPSTNDPYRTVHPKKAIIRVTSSQKGELGERVAICYKRISLIAGWCGDTGQAYLPDAGDEVRVYAKGNTKQECLEVLEPNGIEQIYQ